jgi:NAD(P)-dependent dehydrogenase (short-subunit alcohol dehydrogenase family)
MEGMQTGAIVGSKIGRKTVAMTPLCRAGRPDDIAGVAAFLASDDARWLCQGPTRFPASARSAQKPRIFSAAGLFAAIIACVPLA